MADMSSLTSTSVTSTQLVLPNDRVSVHSVTLPPTPLHRLQAALGGALEEQLLDEPADLHFAVAPDAAAAMKAGRAFEVMVCDKAWLQALLDKALQQGQSITSVVPESAQYQAAGWNLAQFEFRPQSRLSHRLQAGARALCFAPQWRLARVAIVALLLVQIVGINVWAWRDRAALQARREQIAIVLTQTFPETKVVVDAPVQMEKALMQLRVASGALGAQGLEAQLASKASPDKPLGQVDFANNELKVIEQKVSAP
jgi:general secretion pathway protein L